MGLTNLFPHVIIKYNKKRGEQNDDNYFISFNDYDGGSRYCGTRK